MNVYYTPGVYKCRVTGQGFGQASTGTAQFWIKFDVQEKVEPFNDSLEQYSRMTFFSITAKSANWAMHCLRTLGFKGDTFDGVDPNVVDHHSFVGNEVEFVCRHENDQHGTPREKWEPLDTNRWLDGDKVRKLNRLLTKKPQSANGSIMQEIDSAQITDGDVPF